MDLSLAQIAAFAAALAAAGAVSGLLAGLFGIGGGAVLVPAFYQVFGLFGVDDAVRMHLSVGTSLAIIIPTSLSSFRAHYKRGVVDTGLLKSFVVAVPLGVVAASLVAASISSAGLRTIFALMAFTMGVRLLLNRENWRLGTVLPGNPVRFLVGAGIGLLSALMGIGGGIFNNTFMTLYARPMHQAVATSAGVGVLISIPGLLGYVWAGWDDPLLPVASTGFVNWLAVALIIPISLAMAPLGVGIAHAMQKRHLELAFGAFNMLVAARFAWSLVSP